MPDLSFALSVPWWFWIVGGLGLMGLETIVPAGFYLFFIGIAAIGTGILTAAGVVHSLETQGLSLLAFMALTLVLRKPMVRRFQLAPATSVDTLVGETAKASEAIAPGGTGRVELRGTVWTARNLGAAPLAAGATCRVERVDGLTLEVRA